MYSIIHTKGMNGIVNINDKKIGVYGSITNSIDKQYSSKMDDIIPGVSVTSYALNNIPTMDTDCDILVSYSDGIIPLLEDYYKRLIGSTKANSIIYIAIFPPDLFNNNKLITRDNFIVYNSEKYVGPYKKFDCDTCKNILVGDISISDMRNWMYLGELYKSVK